MDGIKLPEWNDLEGRVRDVLVDSDGPAGAKIALVFFYEWLNDNQHHFHPEDDTFMTMKLAVHRLIRPELYNDAS